MPYSDPVTWFSYSTTATQTIVRFSTTFRVFIGRFGWKYYIIYYQNCLFVCLSQVLITFVDGIWFWIGWVVSLGNWFDTYKDKFNLCLGKNDADIIYLITSRHDFKTVTEAKSGESQPTHLQRGEPREGLSINMAHSPGKELTVVGFVSDAKSFGT